MPRLLTSLLVLLLGAWPARPTTQDTALRRVRGKRRGVRLGDADVQEPVEAPERARSRTFGVHHWPGETIFSAGDRRIVVRGRWRFSLDPSQRVQTAGAAGRWSLDPGNAEVWETELESLLTLQVHGARLRVTHADAQGWQLLEARAPTIPETVVLLDRAALAQLFDCAPERMHVSFSVVGATAVGDFAHRGV